MPSGPPVLSLVVVAYGMVRELPRTMRSLCVPYQRDLDTNDYEIIVVDNGSPDPLEVAQPADGLPRITLHRLDPAPPSPARAANEGIALARGDLIGLIIDGARMASPGLLAGVCIAARVAARPVVTAPAWHLGPAVHMHAEAVGYDQRMEDDLLATSHWEDDGYELFSIATPAASSRRGLFGPMGESSSLFMPRALWSEIGGLDERFVLPGGGLVNHDLYRRACLLDDVQLVVVLGEGTFHQIHGGAATSSQVTTEQMRAEYETIRGEPHRPPPNEPCFVGRVPSQYRSYVASSVELTEKKQRRAREYDAAQPDSPAQPTGGRAHMTEDLRASPFGAKQGRFHWLYRLYEYLTLPFAIHFVLSSPRIHPDYKLNAWRRFQLGMRMYRNTRRIWTGVSFRAHLAMAVKLFELPPSQPGVVVECGCFRGGTTANLSLMCRVVGRQLYVYDSFEGLPPPDEGDKYASQQGTGFLKAGLDQVKDHVAAYGAPEVCTYVKGWFADTTPHHEPPIALLFLDVDYQASLTDCILNLWPKLIERGFCFTDEFVFNDYCALFWSEKFWEKHFDRTPPGLVGSGTGISLGEFYLGGTLGMQNDYNFAHPASIAYTRKHWSGYWDYYPDERPASVDAEGDLAG